MLTKIADQGPLAGYIEADETFIPAAYPGVRQTLRPPRKRGSRRTHGTGTNTVRLYAAVKRGGSVRAVILPNMKSETFVQAVKKTVAKGSTLYTDGNKQYITAARARGLKHIRLVSPRRVFIKVKHGRHLNAVKNGLHAAFRSFLSRFNGVSADKIILYFGWYQLLRRQNIQKSLLKIAVTLGWQPCLTCHR